MHMCLQLALHVTVAKLPVLQLFLRVTKQSLVSVSDSLHRMAMPGVVLISFP